MRAWLWKLRYFIGGLVAAYAVVQFLQGILLWKIAEWLQSEPREDSK
jgi:hypothetical protein